jgi:hypothetical protein
MIKPKKNPVTKIIGAGAKAVARTVVGSNKDVKTNKAINKTLEKTFGAKTITAGKAKSIAREKKYGTPSRKVAKQNDSFVNQYARYAKKSGSTLEGNQSLAKSVAPKSVSAKQKSVPVKKKTK